MTLLKNVSISFCVLLLACTARKGAGNNTRVGITTLTVMSYNIHHANPPSQTGVINLDTIAAIIRSQAPDIVALQEVDVHTKRSGTGLNQAAYLAQKTGLHYFFAKAINYEGGGYGVALLSKYPFLDTVTFLLPNEPGVTAEQRVLAKAVLKLPGNEEIVVANTHLDHRKKAHYSGR